MRPPRITVRPDGRCLGRSLAGCKVVTDDRSSAASSCGRRSQTATDDIPDLVAYACKDALAAGSRLIRQVFVAVFTVLMRKRRYVPIFVNHP
jgi:hypothetical protein